MNNTPFFSAPIYALFSKAFYSRVTQSRLSQGFAYLFYLTMIMTGLFFAVAMITGIPQADRFVDWVKIEAPALSVTSEGLQMKAESPYTMIHPQFGPLATFDMKSTEVDVSKIQVPVYITSTKLYVRQRANETRIVDLLAQIKEGRRAPNQVTEITGAVVEQIYRQVKPWIILVAFISFTLIYYVMMMVQGLIFSLVGLILNRFRAVKLTYSAVLNTTFYAMTAGFVLDALKFLLPFLTVIPSGFFVNLLLTSVYLFIGIKGTEEKAA
jgi:hypothetical protein